MRKHAIAALAGVAIILSLDLSTGSPAVAADEQIQQCIRHVAELERTVARQTKVACAKGNIAAAYQAAGKGLEMVKKAGS